MRWKLGILFHRFTAVSVVAFGLVLFLMLFSACGDNKPAENKPPTAVIIDQLSLTNPNERFADEATALLENMGYDVDYIPGEEVTVNFYRNFEGANVVIFRTHMAQTHLREGGEKPSFFSSERFDPYAYVGPLLDGRLSESWMAVEPDKTWFGIMPSFVKYSMDGANFDGATVIMMGCYGLANEGMADAFLARGVEHIFGWNGLVGANHTDKTTLSLLKHLGTDNPADLAMSEVGPDPEYDSVLEHREEG